MFILCCIQGIHLFTKNTIIIHNSACPSCIAIPDANIQRHRLSTGLSSVASLTPFPFPLALLKWLFLGTVLTQNNFGSLSFTCFTLGLMFSPHRPLSEMMGRLITWAEDISNGSDMCSVRNGRNGLMEATYQGTRVSHISGHTGKPHTKPHTRAHG